MMHEFNAYCLPCQHNHRKYSRQVYSMHDLFHFLGKERFCSLSNQFVGWTRIEYDRYADCFNLYLLSLVQNY